MIDKAIAFSSDGKRVEIIGKKFTMRVTKRDAYRLIMVCLAADPRWEVLPADWRDYLTLKVKEQ